jgi:hypothetical protein
LITGDKAESELRGRVVGRGGESVRLGDFGKRQGGDLAVIGVVFVFAIELKTAPNDGRAFSILGEIGEVVKSQGGRGVGHDVSLRKFEGRRNLALAPVGSGDGRSRGETGKPSINPLRTGRGGNRGEKISRWNSISSAFANASGEGGIKVLAAAVFDGRFEWEGSCPRVARREVGNCAGVCHSSGGDLGDSTTTGSIS